MDREKIDLTDILSYTEYIVLKQFILDQGQIETYCNMYNDNPFYQFKNRVSLYLNPKHQFPTLEEAKEMHTYNSMTFRLPEEYTIRYININEDNVAQKVYYYLVKRDLDKEDKLDEVRTDLRGIKEVIFKEIKEQIKD